MISLLWMLVFGVRDSVLAAGASGYSGGQSFSTSMCPPSGPAWAARRPQPSWLHIWIPLSVYPNEPKIFFSTMVCATKEKRLENTAEGDQEPLLGGPTAPELLPSHVLGSSINQEPGEGLAPGLALMPVEWTMAVAGLGQEREVFGQRPLQVTVWKGDLGEDLRERSRPRCLQV